MPQVRETKLDVADWLAEADRLMKRDWCIDTADAGLSAGDCERLWRDGETPEQVVARFADKYDLIRFEPYPPRSL